MLKTTHACGQYGLQGDKHLMTENSIQQVFLIFGQLLLVVRLIQFTGVNEA